MTATPEIRDQIRRYLLGEVDDGTRAEVEQRLLSDGEVFEELLVAEDEIIDDYAGGRLDPEEHAVKFHGAREVRDVQRRVDLRDSEISSGG